MPNFFSMRKIPYVLAIDLLVLALCVWSVSFMAESGISGNDRKERQRTRNTLFQLASFENGRYGYRRERSACCVG